MNIVHRLRCIAVAAVLTSGCAGLATGLGRAAVASGDTAEDAVVRLCVIALLVCVGWAWLAGLAAVREAWLPASGTRAGHGPLRRLVLIACGVAVTGALCGPAALAWDPSDPLDGLPLPERAVGAGTVTHGRPVSAGGEVTVRAGDTLWALASERLPPRADDHAIDVAWRRIYLANRPQIGTDPDLIHPGQTLHLPKEPT